MPKEYCFQLIDESKFLSELGKFVDGNLRFHNFNLGKRASNNADYFGQIKWGTFVIYGVDKIFINRYIVLKIEGAIAHNSLSFKISYPSKIWSVLNALISLLIGIMILFENKLLLGVIFILTAVLQAIVSWRNVKLKKADFLEKISKIDGVERVYK